MTKFKKILEDIKRREMILRENKVPKNFSSKVVRPLNKAHNARKKNHASEKKTLDK